MRGRLFAPCAVLLLLVVACSAFASAQGTPTSSQLLNCDAEPNPGIPDLLESEYVFAFSSLTDVAVTGTIDVRKVTLDSGVESADAIRRAYQAKASGEAEGEALVQSIEDTVSAAFSASLSRAFPGSTVTAQPAVLVPASLEAEREGTCYGPPVIFEVAGGVKINFARLAGAEANERDAEIAFDLGGRLDASFNVNTASGHNATYTFILPDTSDLSVYIAGEPTGATKLSDNEVRLSASAWRSATPVSTTVIIPIMGNGAPAHAAEDVAVDVTVDLKDIITSVGDLMSNKLPTIDVSVDAAAEMAVIEVPASVKERLADSRLTLDYIDANGVRTLLKEGLVTRDQLDAAVEDLLAKVSDSVERLGGDAEGVQGGFAPGTLEAASGPLVFEASADFQIKPGGSDAGAAAMSVYSISQELPLNRIEGFPTEYTVYLPDGIELVSTQYEGGEVERLSKDGRDGFRAAGGDSGSNEMVMTLGITPAFVFAKFTGVVIGVLVVLLLILVGIAMLVVKLVKPKRK